LYSGSGAVMMSELVAGSAWMKPPVLGAAAEVTAVVACGEAPPCGVAMAGAGARAARSAAPGGAESGADHRGQAHRVGVLQVHHPHAAAGADERARPVQPRDGGADVGQTRGVRCADQQGVAACIGQHGDGRATHRHRCAGHGAGTAAVGQALHQRRDVGGHGVLQRHDLHVGARRQVERRDDLAQAREVLGVVGDDQRVAARVGVDGVVGADQRPQHGHEVVRVFVAQREDLRDDLVAALRHLADAHGTGLQLGVGLGHHLQQARGLHHRKAQAAQRRQEAGVGLAHALRLLAVDGDVALDAGVDHDGPFDHRREGTRHGLDVGVDEVHRHRRA
jgi:hypothetical protein